MNLDKIDNLRKGYTVIALTGRTGSGCSEVAERLAKGFVDDKSIFRRPQDIKINHNSYRKYRIVYNYSKENFKPHSLISYKDLLLIFILKKNFGMFISFLADNDKQLSKEFAKSNLQHLFDFKEEVKELKKLRTKFEKLHEQAELATKRAGSFRTLTQELTALKKLYISPEFKQFSKSFNNALETKSKVKRNKLLQIVGNNIRKSGEYDNSSYTNLDNIFSICYLINDLIKAFSKDNKRRKKDTEIVIDSLRNPLEIMFFRQRFSAFYTIAVNRLEEKRKAEIDKRYTKDLTEDVQSLIGEEYMGAKSKDFFKQNVSQCIQNSDIHIAFKSYEEVDALNVAIHNQTEVTSPYFSWQMQLLKFLSLIDHPGIVTPSPEERCMQLAFTAKYNSGCISRQVGAAITDTFYSIKAIGWNNTPEGHVPCNLRNIDDLLNNTGDLEAFTPYERNNPQFKKALEDNFKPNLAQHSKNLKGRSVCFCFKTLINSYSEGKNQVHTRSLHAEESAFLQISKYGGQGIQNGKLFTTASPCELCSKKAYQLGIRVIYYIDPYPGISFEHILSAGNASRNPEMRLFHGAIGNAYHWLYEPFMAYKDELGLILEQNIKDFASKKQELLDLKTNELLSAKNDLLTVIEENDRLRKMLDNKNK